MYLICIPTEVEGGCEDGDFSDGDAIDMEELLQIDCAAGGGVLKAPFWTIHVDTVLEIYGPNGSLASRSNQSDKA